MKIMSYACVIVSIFCHTASAMSRGRVALDPVTLSSVLDGDATGLVEGCGNQPQVGFTYCRFQEGDAANQQIWFMGPPARCEKESCVYIKVWDNNGVLVWGGAISKDRSRVGVSWTTLLSGSTFELNRRGFWTWNMEVFWKDPDGRERVSKAQGDIVLRIYRNGYLPLHEISSDPAFVWEWAQGKCTYKMTSGLRANIQCSK